ncbi:MAG: hypothetical protein KQH63_05860 [Desulfobulbaceae bacterium]|nr:hypothetical protein [Desulfobulbaceae bacterium]
MKQFTKHLFFVLLISAFFCGCAHEEAALDTPPPDVFTPTSDQGGQLPEDVLRQASENHGGSMIPAGGDNMAGGGMTAQGGTMAGTTVVLGPVNAERVIDAEEVSADAGQSIREIISQKLTSNSDITLFDAPEERFIDDSPRPDLARKGVKFVLKGVASSSSDSGETTVFLRAVNTMTGKVAMVSSARHQSRDQAAAQAAEHLLQKITGVK